MSNTPTTSRAAKAAKATNKPDSASKEGNDAAAPGNSTKSLKEAYRTLYPDMADKELDALVRKAMADAQKRSNSEKERRESKCSQFTAALTSYHSTLQRYKTAMRR